MLLHKPSAWLRKIFTYGLITWRVYRQQQYSTCLYQALRKRNLEWWPVDENMNDATKDWMADSTLNMVTLKLEELGRSCFATVCCDWWSTCHLVFEDLRNHHVPFTFWRTATWTMSFAVWMPTTISPHSVKSQVAPRTHWAWSSQRTWSRQCAWSRARTWWTGCSSNLPYYNVHSFHSWVWCDSEQQLFFSGHAFGWQLHGPICDTTQAYWLWFQFSLCSNRIGSGWFSSELRWCREAYGYWDNHHGWRWNCFPKSNQHGWWWNSFPENGWPWWSYGFSFFCGSSALSQRFVGGCSKSACKTQASREGSQQSSSKTQAKSQGKGSGQKASRQSEGITKVQGKGREEE